MNSIIALLLASLLVCSLADPSAKPTAKPTPKPTRNPTLKPTAYTPTSPCDLGGVTTYTSPIPFHGDGTVPPSKIVTPSVHYFFNGTNFVSSLPAGTSTYCLGFTYFDDVNTTTHDMFLAIQVGKEYVISPDLKVGMVKTYWFTSTVASLTFTTTGYFEDQINSIFTKSFTVNTWKNTVVNFYSYNGYNYYVDTFAPVSTSSSMVVSNSDYTTDFLNSGYYTTYLYWYMNANAYTVYLASKSSFTYPKTIDLTLYKINICSTSSNADAYCPVVNLTPAINSIAMGQMLYVMVTPGKVYQFITQ